MHNKLKKIKIIDIMDPEQDPDPLYHETDPRIRIQIKMKRIHNTDWKFKRGQVYCDQKTKFT